MTPEVKSKLPPKLCFMEPRVVKKAIFLAEEQALRESQEEEANEQSSQTATPTTLSEDNAITLFAEAIAPPELTLLDIEEVLAENADWREKIGAPLVGSSVHLDISA